MMETIYFIWIGLQILVGFNLFFPLLLSCFFLAVKAFGRSRWDLDSREAEADYAIVVTAYEQTDHIDAVVGSLLGLNYSKYIIYVVADNCDVSRLEVNHSNVIVLRPDSIIANNVGSHFYAINRFIRKHDRITIIDSDNVVDAEYLNGLNVYFDKGYKAVQGVRRPKNLNSVYACLDAARDIYYHFYDGKLLFRSGSSATLSGSGMAFTTSLYKDCLRKLDVQGAGFDKVLQYEIIKRGERIAFAEEAIVFDEKTSRPDVLVSQRSRWINTWFKYSYFGFKLIGKGLIDKSWNQLLFGVVLLRPPLFIFLLLSLFFLFVNLFISAQSVYVWSFGLGLFLLSFLVALANSATDKRIYSSLMSIPKFIYWQVLSLVKARNANKYSVATRHVADNINDHEK